MPCMQCQSSTLYLDSAFCEAHFRSMFPKAYTKLQEADDFIEGIKQADLVNAVCAAILEAEELYRAESLCYPDETDDKHKRTHGSANGFSTRNMKFTPTESRPSTALRKFFGVGTVCECHSLIVAVYYKALLDVLGDFWFDRAFKRMCIINGSGFGLLPNPIKDVMDSFPVQEDLFNIAIGDWVYVVNRADYKDKHPAGAAAGWNLICTELNPLKFVGFGLSAKGGTGSLGLPEILAILKDYYNMAPTEDDIRMGHLGAKNIDMMSLMTMTGGGKSQPRLDTTKPGRRLSAARLKAYLRAVQTQLKRTVV
jgi:hypothetical protein